MLEMAGPWITEHEERIVLDAMRNGWYGDKKYAYVEKFEAEFAAYHHRRYALMTPNCTSAIHLLLAGLGLGQGDEVIVPECTWIATCAPISYVGATPVFADIDQSSWCLSAQTCKQAITPRSKAAIVVDLYGNMPDWPALEAMAKDKNILLIEDAAEALGSVQAGKRAGQFGVASVFSFHRTKTITTGEGGMVLMDDSALYERCKFLRDHGRAPERDYYNTEVAFKYMPFNIQAALGYAQLCRIDELIARKRWIYHQYQQYLANVEHILLNPEPTGVINGVWAPALVWQHRGDLDKATLIDECRKQGLHIRPFFYPLSSLPAYNQQDHYAPINQTAYDIANRGVNLPAAYTITENDIADVATTLKQVLNKRKSLNVNQAV